MPIKTLGCINELGNKCIRQRIHSAYIFTRPAISAALGMKTTAIMDNLVWTAHNSDKYFWSQGVWIRQPTYFDWLVCLQATSTEYAHSKSMTAVMNTT